MGIQLFATASHASVVDAGRVDTVLGNAAFDHEQSPMKNGIQHHHHSAN